MNRQIVPGAFYGEQLPSGEWMAVVPGDGFYTHLGKTPLPPGQHTLAQPRCTNVAGFRFGGQVGDGIEPAAWQYDGGQWHSYPQPCVGVNATIYDRTGAFIRSDGSVGSQGFRYVTPENVIVSGDATYRKQIPYPAPANSIFEYTDLGDGLFIGQAAYDNGGVQVWDGSVLRQLETGVTTFVRANRDGENVGVAFTLGSVGVVRILTTMAELRALPAVVTSAPPPPSVDPPKPPDQPKEPPVSTVPDYSSLVESLKPSLPLAELNRLNDIADATRAAKGEDHPDTQAAEQAVNQVKGACCQTIVAALNAHEGAQRWGLLSKTGGQRWIRSDGENLSTDIAFNPSLARLVDVMGDRRPSWDVHPPDDVQPAEKFRLPLMSAPPVEPPKPPDQPPQVDSGLTARVLALEMLASSLKARADVQVDLIAAMKKQIDALPASSVDLSGYAKKGDKVTVEISIPFVRTIKASGTIDK